MTDNAHSQTPDGSALAKVEHYARRVLGGAFAGAYSEPDGSVTLLYAGQALDRAVVSTLTSFGAPLRLRKVEHGLESLLSLQRLIQSTRPFDTQFGAQQGVIAVSIRLNTVVVTVDRISDAMRRFAAEGFGTAVTVREPPRYVPLSDA